MKCFTHCIAQCLLIASIFIFLNSSFAAETREKLTIVSTVAPITNIVRNIGGTHVRVVGIVPDGIDSHTFEPIPSDIKILQVADMIIMNGLDLELPALKLAEKVKNPNTPILLLGNLTLKKEDWQYDFSFPREHGHPNPHLWLNVELVKRYADIIHESLAELDPAHQLDYQKNTLAYLNKLEKLDEAIFKCVDTIPVNHRKLVTYHDSFAYFAPRYGMSVIAAVQPADFSEPGPQEVIRIIKHIKEAGVPAIFGSEVFPSKVMEQIAREAKVNFIDQLSDDELPAPPNHSYIGMMARNVAIMTEALKGNSTCMAHVDAKNIPF
ncbi:MAG: zinc ABC transporter substrate-binding protein [Nitrosomonas sp.]|nr:zinc ABC transporter substrate-binding protein [Nitrosomonas sp.]